LSMESIEWSKAFICEKRWNCFCVRASVSSFVHHATGHGHNLAMPELGCQREYGMR
jgi:hypothetical protein